MRDIGKFTEPKNKMVSLLPWEPWLSEFEVQRIDTLALIIEILYLKQIFFWNEQLFVSINYFHWQYAGCFEIDLGLKKLSNV